jgi:hypothetical protein
MVLVMAGVGAAALLFLVFCWGIMVLLVRMVLRYSEGGPERKRMAPANRRLGARPLSRADVQRLEAERLLLEEQRRVLEAAADLQSGPHGLVLPQPRPLTEAQDRTRGDPVVNRIPNSQYCLLDRRPVTGRQWRRALLALP